MDKPKSQCQQDKHHYTHRGEHSATDVLAHGLAVSAVLQHHSHGQKEVDNHVYQQRYQNHFNQHKSSFARHQLLHMIRRQPLIALIIAVLAILTMCRLGWWQLDRMHEKEQRLASIAQKQTETPQRAADMIQRNDDIRDYPVTITGHFTDLPLVYLDNRIHNGRVGFEVLTAVQLQGASGALPVLVNLGWVPAGVTRSDLPSVILPKPLQQAGGVIAVPADNPVIRETTTGAINNTLLLQQLDIQRLQNLTGQQFQPFVVQLTDPHPHFLRDWKPVVMPPKKHLAYAIQWFGLAIAASIITLILMLPRGISHDRKNNP